MYSISYFQELEQLIPSKIVLLFAVFFIVYSIYPIYERIMNIRIYYRNSSNVSRNWFNSDKAFPVPNITEYRGCSTT